MSDTGWKSPGTVVMDNSNGGFSTWDWLDYIKDWDNNPAGNYWWEGIANYCRDHSVLIVDGNGTIGSENKAVSGNWSTSRTTIVYGGNDDLWGEEFGGGDINSSDFGMVFSADMDDSVGEEWVETQYIKCSNFGFEIPEEAEIDGIEVRMNRGWDNYWSSLNIYGIQIKVYYTEGDTPSETPTVGVKYPLPAFRSS